jgi:membrane protein YdbS with pleckstrin-like domain
MSIEHQDIRKIGIWFLLLAFVFGAIILAADAPPAVISVTFTLLLVLEILFALSLNPPQLVSSGYHFGIRSRSPPKR